MKAVSNQYAAMPSMHVGWSTWSALVLVPLVRRRWAKVLAASYPLITTFVIMITGNHYWIDGVGGIAFLAAGFALAKVVTRWREQHREGVRPAWWDLLVAVGPGSPVRPASGWAGRGTRRWRGAPRRRPARW
jgi:hypothetical protein